MSGNRVKHRVRRGVCALLTAALLAPVWGSALPVGAVTQSEIDALKSRQAESQERQAELEEQLTRAEADRDAAREQRQLLGQQLDAISSGNYYKTPYGPYGWLSSPPSVQRYLGMLWLGALLYPDYCEYDLQAEVTEYYELFYQCELTQEMYDNLMAGAMPE